MDAAKFWTKVEKSDGCWLWQGARIPEGYGQAVFDGRVQGAHRIAYQLLVGPIPAGLQLDHLCRTPQCVNPAHLEPVTGRENVLRTPNAPTAINARKTHCDRGHELVRRNSSGRSCVECPRLTRHGRRIAAGLRVRVAFTADQITAIRNAIASGVPSSAIAPGFGVSPRTIERVARGRWQRGFGEWA